MTVVAIDGPAGAGKSTVARGVADALGFAYLDTGALYRAVALAVVTRDVDPADQRGVEETVRWARIELADDRVALDGDDVTDRIRSPDVTSIVSQVAAYPGVRATLLARQREAAAAGDVVIEGRDIGTVVVPEADVKVFLTADPSERAVRRVRQLGLDEDAATLADVEALIRQRDAADASRNTSPFARAADAVVVDSSGRSPQDVVGEIVALVRRGER